MKEYLKKLVDRTPHKNLHEAIVVELTNQENFDKHLKLLQQRYNGYKISVIQVGEEVIFEEDETKYCKLIIWR